KRMQKWLEPVSAHRIDERRYRSCAAICRQRARTDDTSRRSVPEISERMKGQHPEFRQAAGGINGLEATWHLMAWYSTMRAVIFSGLRFHAQHCNAANRPERACAVKSNPSTRRSTIDSGLGCPWLRLAARHCARPRPGWHLGPRCGSLRPGECLEGE